MIAATERPQASNISFRHRLLTLLKGKDVYLPISQSRYRKAVAKIKAGIRITTRSDFITTNFTLFS
jgi:hypothetical protein